MTQNFGWIDDPAEAARIVATLPRPLFGDAAAHLKDTGAGKTVLLYEAARKVMGRDLDTGHQKIGDCVSWGWAGAVDLLACVEVLAGEAEAYDYDGRACTEAVYALSRVEYGNLDGSYEDGSVGGWAAKAVSVGGTISRKRLGAYDPQRAKRWGAKGLPDELEPEAKQHLVKTVSLVTSFEEARDAIANGYPVAVCSNAGFGGRRDKDGFIRWNTSWAHCMKFTASRDDRRPGLLLTDSNPKPSDFGPKGEFDIPDESWWVDADDVNKMLRGRESYSLSAFDGYEARRIDWYI
jgi:hypothetical protein